MFLLLEKQVTDEKEFFFFQVENELICLAAFDRDFSLKFAVMSDSKFICGLLALEHKKRVAGLRKIGWQLKPRMPIKSKITSLVKNTLLSP